MNFAFVVHRGYWQSNSYALPLPAICISSHPYALIRQQVKIYIYDLTNTYFEGRKLKGKGITSDWRELVRVMNTQKCVTTSMDNDKGQRLSIRCCSKPEPKVALLYDALQMKQAPFIRKKSVVLKIEPATNRKSDLQRDTSWILQCGLTSILLSTI